MRPLVYKDFMSAKASYLVGTLIILFISTYSIGQEMYINIPLIFILLPILLNGISFGVEEQSGMPKFIFITPISRATYVKSKYVISLGSALIAGCLSVLILRKSGLKMDLSLILSALVLSIPLIFSSIQIPFFLKYGGEKGRIFMVAIYFLIFVGSSLLGDYKEDILVEIQDLSLSQPYLVFILIIILNLAILLISIGIGIRIIQDKEY